MNQDRRVIGDLFHNTYTYAFFFWFSNITHSLAPHLQRYLYGQIGDLPPEK